MKALYKIKENHPIKDFIRQEIIDVCPLYGEDIGISTSTIYNEPYTSEDLYGLKFNSNNRSVSCIDINIFMEPKSDNSPRIIEGDRSGYDYYKSSTSCAIKLKTFLEKNSQWSNVEEWAVPVIKEKTKCKYMENNSNERRAFIKRPDDKIYDVKFPKNKKYDNILTWIKPIEERLTKKYYKELEFDEKNNIKREQSVWVNGVCFYYNYNDGIVEIYNILNGWNSIYANLIGLELLDISIGIPQPTKEKIKKEIESADIFVKDIILVPYKCYPKYIKIE
jgi:hypothetical protein